jgi:hypothetical protein
LACLLAPVFFFYLQKVLGQVDPFWGLKWFESICLCQVADIKNMPVWMGEGATQWADAFFLPWRVGYFFINIDILHNKKGKEKEKNRKDKTLP